MGLLLLILIEVTFLTLPGSTVKSEPVESDLIPDKQKESTKQLASIRPDALLGLDWLEQSSGCVKEQAIMTDAFATLLGDDTATDYKHMASGSSTSSQGWGFGSCAWNNMPAVCQMSDRP